MTNVSDPSWSPKREQDFWYELTLSYEDYEYAYTGTSDVDVWQRYEDGHIDEHGLFDSVDAPFPENFEYDKLSFIVERVQEGDELAGGQQ